MSRTKSPRIGKINDVLHREIASQLNLYCQENNLDMLTVAAVEVASSLSHAKVFITIFHKDEENNKAAIEKIIEQLNLDKKMFRHKLSKTLALRKVPELRFYYDNSVEEGYKINKLLNKVNE